MPRSSPRESTSSDRAFRLRSAGPMASQSLCPWCWSYFSISRSAGLGREDATARLAGIGSALASGTCFRVMVVTFSRGQPCHCHRFVIIFRVWPIFGSLDLRPHCRGALGLSLIVPGVSIRRGLLRPSQAWEESKPYLPTHQLPVNTRAPRGSRRGGVPDNVVVGVSHERGRRVWTFSSTIQSGRGSRTRYRLLFD